MPDPAAPSAIDPNMFAQLRAIFARLAPEVDLADVPLAADLRQELQIDSMDFLEYVIALHERFGVSIPEADYERVASLAGAAEYLRERGGA